MGNSRFDILAALILSGEATEKQKIEFEELLKDADDKRIFFDKLRQAWNTNLKEESEIYKEQNQALWLKYQAHRRSQNIDMPFWRPYLKVAAVILVLVTAYFPLHMLIIQKVTPDKDAIVEVKNIMKETNLGEKLKTRLPDGTSVYLNAGSKLIYPEQFSDSNRVVQLVGEGYFDVVKDAQRPFTVCTMTMDVTALGTVFNLDVYSENKEDKVALASGSLLIKNNKNQSVKIDSGETVTLSRENYTFSKSRLDYLDQIAWKDGILYFNNNQFSEIIKTLEKNYAVNFVISEDFNPIQDTYTGLFKDEVLDNILNVLSFTLDFQYEINGKEILIKNKSRIS